MTHKKWCCVKFSAIKSFVITLLNNRDDQLSVIRSQSYDLFTDPSSMLQSTISIINEQIIPWSSIVSI